MAGPLTQAHILPSGQGPSELEQQYPTLASHVMPIVNGVKDLASTVADGVMHPMQRAHYLAQNILQNPEQFGEVMNGFGADGGGGLGFAGMTKGVKPLNGVLNVTPKVLPITTRLSDPNGVDAFIAKYGRKPVSQMTEQERVANFGPAMAETPTMPFSDLKSRKVIDMPGGLDTSAGPLTLADQAKISAQGINYNDIDPANALAIHKRLVQSVDPGANPSTLEKMNRLGFGISSGNAPITKNLLEWAQLRPRNMNELKEWAGYSPVGFNEQIPGGAIEMNRAINQAYGVQAGDKGGTGVANTANRQYISDLAGMLDQKPEWFSRGANEPEGQYVERLINQVRGLGPKTGSLGFAMIEPQTSNISAIDRHIADLTREAVSADPATQGIYQDQMLNGFNIDRPKNDQYPDYHTARADQIGLGEDPDITEASKFRDIVSTPSTTKFIDAKTGQPRSTIPSHLLNLPFYQPEQAATIGPIYQKALEQIQAGGQPRGIGGFSNQWHDWDFQRSRAEPHAAMNPMATEMERLTPEEYQQVRDTFSEMGALKTNKDPNTGRLHPFTPIYNLDHLTVPDVDSPMPSGPGDDWKKLIYGSADPSTDTNAA